MTYFCYSLVHGRLMTKLFDFEKFVKILFNIAQQSQLYNVDTCLKQEEFHYLLYIIMRPCLVILSRYEGEPRHFFAQL